MTAGTPRVLVIRRENIGDLVCTTPLIAALRRQLPDAYIAALVTRYNEGVLADNPDIDELYSYTKAKHRRPGETVLAVHARRLRTILKLRGQEFDWVLLPGGAHRSALRFAKWIGGRRVLVRGEEDLVAGTHEVEQVCHLLTRMGLEYSTPTPRVIAPADEVATVSKILAERALGGSGPMIGLHVSARKPSQRWPADRFSELARRLHERFNARLMLLWAPGRNDDPLHPGDDEKAAQVMAKAGNVPMVAVPTLRLNELIAAISLCDHFICGDGGAMHLAAGLGKPIVALFGQSAPERWRPWGVPNVVLQKPSLDVADVSVDEVLAAYGRVALAKEPGS